MVTARHLNVVLTGVPRAGTTLVCHLLNKVPDTVALHEPIDPESVARARSTQAMCDAVERFYMETRESLRTSGTARCQQLAGEVPDNPASDIVGPEHLRPSRVSMGDIRFARPLSDDFVLVIKHNAMFTALLDELRARLPCFAVVRNPLAVLASWSTVDMPVHGGHAPAAERIDHGLANALARLEDRVDRQLHLLSWFYDHFRRLLPQDRVLRYEEIVASGGKCLAPLVAAEVDLSEALGNRNSNPLYGPELLVTMSRRLLRSEGAYWHFYSRDSVDQLAREPHA